MAYTEEMTKSEYARHAGVSKGRISQLTGPSGLLAVAVTPSGKIKVEIADRLRGKAFDPANNKSKPLPSQPEPDGETADQVKAEEEILDYRRRSAAVKAATDELNLAEKQGALVDRARLKAALDDRLRTLFVNLRQGRQTIGDRLIGEQQAPAENRAEILAIIGEEIDKMIDDFRRSLTAGSTDA